MSASPYRDGAKAYRGLGLGQAVPVHRTKNNQPTTGLIGKEAPRSGDTPRAREKEWRARKYGTWNLGIHPAETVRSLDVDDPGEFRALLKERGIQLPVTAFSTARGADSARRQLVYRVEADCPTADRLANPSSCPEGRSTGEVADVGHRYIRAWPSVHPKSGNGYAWYFPATDDPLGVGRAMDTPPSVDELGYLSTDLFVALTRAPGARTEHGPTVTTEDVEKWMSAESSPDMDRRTRERIHALPLDGATDMDLLSYLIPVVRAVHESRRGRRAAIQAFEEAWFDGHASSNRAKFGRHDVGRALSTVLASDEATQLTSFALPATKKKTKAGKGKTDKARAHVEHDEYEPRPLVSAKPPSQPMEVAHQLIEERAIPPLLNAADQWYSYQDGHWMPTGNAEVFDLVSLALRDAEYLRPVGKSKSGEKQDLESAPWAPAPSRIDAVVRMLRTLSPLDSTAPHWLDGRADACRLIPCRDGLLDPATRTLHPRSRQYFSTSYLNASLRAKPKRPKRWLAFLKSVWGDDEKSIALLQEWLGYVISGDTSRHKGLMMIGPTRSGKGTIIRLAGELVGKDARSSTTMTGIVGEFGLQRAVSSSLLTLGDLRGSGPQVAVATQKLLEIIGGDEVYVNRKNKDQVSETFSARVMIGTNAIPTLYDDSAAIDGRFLLLSMEESYLDREDRNLDRDLMGGLDGIADWALEGFARLQTQGRFTVPDSDAADRAEFRSSSSPIAEFVDSACMRVKGHGAKRLDLWDGYRLWYRRTYGQGSEPDIKPGAFRKAIGALGHRLRRPQDLDDPSRPERYYGIALREEVTAADRAKAIWGSHLPVTTSVEK